MKGKRGSAGEKREAASGVLRAGGGEVIDPLPPACSK